MTMVYIRSRLVTETNTETDMQLYSCVHATLCGSPTEWWGKDQKRFPGKMWLNEALKDKQDITRQNQGPGWPWTVITLSRSSSPEGGVGERARSGRGKDRWNHKVFEEEQSGGREREKERERKIHFIEEKIEVPRDGFWPRFPGQVALTPPSPFELKINQLWL